MPISAVAAQTPLTDLYLSLVAGVGQVIIGLAMVLYSARRARWRQITFFGLALIGAWLAASGITELIVSGTELLSRLSSNFSATSAQQIRARADSAFLGVSLALLALGVGYLLFARLWRTTPGSAAAPANAEQDTARGEAAADAPTGEVAEVSSSEPES